MGCLVFVGWFVVIDSINGIVGFTEMVCLERVVGWSDVGNLVGIVGAGWRVASGLVKVFVFSKYSFDISFSGSFEDVSEMATVVLVGIEPEEPTEIFEEVDSVNCRGKSFFGDANRGVEGSSRDVNRVVCWVGFGEDGYLLRRGRI